MHALLNSLNNNSRGRIKLQTVLYLLLLLLILFPYAQTKLRFINEPLLNGAYTVPSDSTNVGLSVENWLSGDFQKDKEVRAEYFSGFRNTLIKINNQLSYSLFSKPHAEGTVVGKNNILFEEDYLLEYAGRYYVGDSVWINKAVHLKQVQDTLKSMGKTFLVIIEPDKASFYAEQLPEEYQKMRMGISNYNQFILQLRKNNVNVLDLRQDFLNRKKNKSKYDHEFPLYTPGGIHWTNYGSVIGADTTIKYLEKISGKDLPDMFIKSVEPCYEPLHPDNDIEKALNLIIPNNQPVTGNPILEFTSKSEKYNALIVGDSYYFNWMQYKIPPNIFKSCDFWYYNKRIVLANYAQGGFTGELDLQTEIMKKDFIIIMITGRFMHAFAWNFDEELFDLFYPGQRNRLESYESNTRKTDHKFKRLFDKAAKDGNTLEEQIRADAMYLFYLDYKKNPEAYTSKEDQILIIENAIRSTPDWLEKIRNSAKEKHINVDKEIRNNAEWVYNHQKKKD